MKVVEEVNKQVNDEIKDGEFRIVAKELSLEKSFEFVPSLNFISHSCHSYSLLGTLSSILRPLMRRKGRSNL